MKNHASSIISYVVAGLLLSGQVFANPSDLSGNVKTQFKHDSQDYEQGFYMALNRYPVAIPPISVERLSSEDSFNALDTSEKYLDDLQLRLRDELDLIIEAREL